MGLIPERQGTRIKQSALLVLAEVIGLIADFLSFLWAEGMPVWERLVGVVGVGVLILTALNGLLSWCWA
jgi:hypothetical protein